MRATRKDSSSRFEIMAETWGRVSIPAKVAPPLKSTRTKLSWTGSWVRAMARTIVRSTSDLPEPVAPMSMPCGPMPFFADSLMSMMTGPPASVSPKGTRRYSRPLR